jgi:hypothetical protein
VLVTPWVDAATFYFFRSLYLSVILSNFDIILQLRVENEKKGNAALRNPLSDGIIHVPVFLLESRSVPNTAVFFIFKRFDLWIE